MHGLRCLAWLSIALHGLALFSGSWVAGVAVFALFGPVFCSLAAYFAIFYFVQQQFGFLMLYRRGEAVGGGIALLGANINRLVQAQEKRLGILTHAEPHK